jgi:hypothetical protein
MISMIRGARCSFFVAEHSNATIITDRSGEYAVLPEPGYLFVGNRKGDFVASGRPMMREGGGGDRITKNAA